MSSVDLNKISRVHFIGIGGIGMSGLARFFLHEKKVVSGSDRAPSAITDKLVHEGVTFFETQSATNITSDIELIIYTEAMAKDQEEMVAAKALNVPMMNYFEALGLVANEYFLIAVAGSHGKTTTTAMIIDILEEVGLDPTAIVGSLRSKTGSNFRSGKSKFAVVEACEYKRDFLHLRPDVLVITNVEYEHVDYYKDLGDVQAAFRDLAKQVKEGGIIVAPLHEASIKPIVADLPLKVVDYQNYLDLRLALHLPGIHNRLNAAAALAATASVGVDASVAKEALENFAGTWRRFQFRGEYNGAIIYDDYGHHPTEIKATIAGARELYPERKLTLVFQSHTYTRTNTLFSDFVEALALADEIILLPIYAAREENVSGVSSEKIAEALTLKGKKVTVFATHGAAALQIKETVSKLDVVLVMGAGDVTKVADLL